MTAIGKIMRAILPRSRAIQIRCVLVAALLTALWLVNDEPVTLWHALEWHEPSARIFRLLWQIDLLLWGTAASLMLWNKCIGTSTIKELLFCNTSQDGGRSADYSSIAHYNDEENESSHEKSNNNHSNDKQSLLSIELTNISYKNNEDDENNNDNHTSISHIFRNNNKLENNVNDDMLVGETDADVLSDADSIPINNDDDADIYFYGNHNSSTDAVLSPLAVVQAALDLLVYLLFTLFLYVWSLSTTIVQQSVLSRFAAPTFPLLLFVFLAYRLVNVRRSEFWQLLSYTVCAPWYSVTFRDGMIGDILTSAVRPLQDLCFTLAYLIFGLRTWWSKNTINNGIDIGNIDLNISDSTTLPLIERSWLLHTFVLPMCLLSPLWWRFAQTLRQCHDERIRWPYLGNALKYFVAAQVATVSIYFPQCKDTWWWLMSFVVATLYQVWWDVFMDWRLLTLNTSTGRYQLRSRRLYPWKGLYWMIFVINFVLRFGWTLTFMPSNYLDPTGRLKNNWPSLLNSTMATAELVRRTLWAWIRVEWQAIQDQGDDIDDNSSNIETGMSDEKSGKPNELVMQPMIIPTQIVSGRTILSNMNTIDPLYIYVELGLYAAAFGALWSVSALHRMTL